MMSNLQEYDDIHLLKFAQDGNVDAFGELYERYAPQVFRFLYAHLDNRMDAEDLLGEVFLRVWRSLSKYRERGVPFLAFLFRIARNALIDHYRRAGKARQEVPIEDVSLRDHGLGPGETVTANLEQEEIRQTLGKLREDYRTVLVLRFLSELTPEETAEVMERSSGAVRVLQHRALAALRKLMDEK